MIDMDLKNVLITLRSFENNGTWRDPVEYEVFNDMIHRGVEGIQKLERILNADVSNFLDFTDTEIVISDVIACDNRILENLQEFHKFHTSPDDMKTGKDAADKLDKLKKSIPGVISCLERFQVMSQGSLKTSKIVGTLENLKDLEILETWAKEHELFKETFGKFISGLSQMIRDFQGMKVIWNQEPSNSGSLLSHVIDLQMRLSDGEHVHDGFQKGPSDISKVVDDVKSRWFREKISRGKDIGPLVRGLTPIAERSKFLEAVTNDYETIHHLFTDNKDLIKKTSENLEIIEKFVKQKLGGDTENVLSVTKGFLGNCAPRSLITIDNDVISAFDKAFNKPRSLIKKVDTIRDTVEQVIKKFEISVLINALSETGKLIRDDLSIKNSLLEYGRLKKSESFGLAEPIFKELDELFRAQEQLELDFEQLKDIQDAKPFEDLQKVMISTDMISAFKCFENNRYDYDKIHKAIDFIHSVQELSDPQNFRISENYLTRIAMLQTDFKEMEGNMNSRRRFRRAQNPVLLLNDSIGLALHLGEGMEVLHQMVLIQKRPEILKGPETYHSDVLKLIRTRDKSKFWRNPKLSIDPVLAGIEKLEKLAPEIRSGVELMSIRRVLQEAEKVPGIPDFQEKFQNVPEYLKAQSTKAEFRKAMDNAQILKSWDLDFAAHQKKLNAAYLSLESIAWYFDDIFGFKKSGVM